MMQKIRNKIRRGEIIIEVVQRAPTFDFDAHHGQLAPVPEVPEVGPLPHPNTVPNAAKKIKQ